MKIVVIGASVLATATARILLARGHDVVIVDKDRVVIDALSEELDCGFVQGDGTRPAILREVGPKDSDVLLCLTHNDQDNILAALVGRSLGFPRVVPMIRESEYATICSELGLSDTILPDQTIARTLADMVAGYDILELSSMIKGEVRFFSFIVHGDGADTVEALDLPSEARVICVYRGRGFVLPEPDTKLSQGDQVVVITHSRNLEALREQFAEHPKE
jgi:trk system potassium uptake protein TrkA